MQKITDALRLHGRPADGAGLAAGVHTYDFPGPTPVQFKTVFPQTPDGKIHMTPPALGGTPFHYRPVDSGRFPLALISPASSKTITSTLGEFNLPELWLSMHPADAAARTLADGDEVRVFNDLGEVLCCVRLSERIRPGVVSMPKGAWLKSSLNGRTATALCPAEVNEVGGGACYNDARVEVLKSEPRR